MNKDKTEYWRIQGKKKGKWIDRSTQWRDRKPSKEEARDLFKGIKEDYSSIRLIKVKRNQEKVEWEDKELLKQEIPIETVK
ncbi:MAG: hypothetical protein ACOCTT_04015 [archaeon]